MTRTPLLSRGSDREAAPGRSASSGTAARFAARVRSRRRQRWATAAAAAVLLLVAAWLALFSPWLKVETVRVVGASRVDPAQVHQVADAQLHRPMILLDPRSVASRVATIPLIRSVTVSRHWPSTLLVTVHERVPVAAVPAQGGGYRLVDQDGVEVTTSTAKPADLPFLQVDMAAAGPAALVAALQVQAALPATLGDQLQTLGATSRDGVWFTLDNGARVTWGSATDGARKLEVLRALVHTSPKAASYDVSAPAAPAVAARTLRKPVTDFS